MSNSEIGNIFKKNYKVEKYSDSLCRKLVSLYGDEVDYKVIFGLKLEMVYTREKKKESNYDIMQSKLRLTNIVKLYELSFNIKLNKYSSKYLKIYLIYLIKMIKIILKKENYYLIIIKNKI